jgi:cyclophilin family peptidyl-prolyl cis-trans isomerase/HEAT repeat protein
VLLVAAASCAPRPVPAPALPPPPPEARRVVLGPAEVTALAEVLQAEDQRTLDSVRIASLLAHPLPEIRERAAWAAGRIRDHRAEAMLVRALDDSVPVVGASAAFALGQLGDTSSTIVYSLVRRLGVTWMENDERGVEAVMTLGRIGTPAAHAALIQVLQRYVPPEASTLNGSDTVNSVELGEVGKEALLAIWRFPRAESAVELIVPHLASTDVEVRWRAAYSLMRIGSPRTVSRMRELLRDAHPLVRSLAARALRAPTVDSAQQRAETMTALAAALQDSDPHVQVNALAAIATFRDSTIVSAVLELLSSADGNVRMAANQALPAVAGSVAAEALVGVARSDDHPIAMRGTALAGLVRVNPPRGVNEAAQWIRSESWLARLYATRALAAATWTDAGRHLRRLAEDPDPRVAAAALGAMTALTDTLSAPYALYIQLLGAADIGMRAAAIRGLGRRGSPADLSALMDAYDRAQRDTINDAALAAIDALAALETRGVPVSRAFFLRFPRSQDAEVRERVAQRFAERWGESPTPAPRDLAFYEDVVRNVVAPGLALEAPPHATIHTAAGTIVIELAATQAPLTVHNFITLATNGYFPRPDSAGESRFRWHRVVPNFVVQDGDSRGDGSGGPGYAIRDEINRLRYTRGAVGMASSGPDTGGSQFFITHSPQPHLDGGYTVFGRVIYGMDVVDRVLQDDPIFSVVITR